jgi:hypothetical protein
MKLNEVFNYLVSGELSQVFMAESDGRETVAGDFQRPLTQSIQLGLTALYKRFNLKNKEITLQLLPGRTTFPLRSQHLVSSTVLDVPKFIEDTPESPFRDDVLQITKIYTLDGVEFPLNDRTNQYTSTTPVPDTLMIPHALAFKDVSLPDQYKVDKMRIAYRANHPNLMSRIGPINADRIEIELPHTHLQALLYYVASRKTNPQGMSNEFHTGNSWYQKYEMECKQLEQEGMGEIVDLNTLRFRRNGWV